MLLIAAVLSGSSRDERSSIDARSVSSTRWPASMRKSRPLGLRGSLRLLRPSVRHIANVAPIELNPESYCFEQVGSVSPEVAYQLTNVVPRGLILANIDCRSL